MPCRIAYVQQSDIEPILCCFDSKQYLKDHPEILESTDLFGSPNFVGEDDCIMWLKTKYKATMYCEAHEMYLCQKCKENHIQG